MGKLGTIKDQICASKFPKTYAARMAKRKKKKDAERAKTVEAAKSRDDAADAPPARRALSARRPHFADQRAEPSTRVPGTPVSKVLESGKLLKRRFEAVHLPQAGEPLSPPRRRPSPTTATVMGRQLVPATVQHPTYVSDSGRGTLIEEAGEDEPATRFPAQLVQGAYSTTHNPSSDDEYDEVFDATSECNSCGSETGSVFERRMGEFRDRYSKNRSPKFVNRQSAIARCRRAYTCSLLFNSSP